jgi:DNA-binding CsgD family transcriptional regulator
MCSGLYNHAGRRQDQAGRSIRNIVPGCSLLLMLLAVPVQSQLPCEIRNFTKQEYRAESQNWSLTTDSEGYVYVANNVGLLEFDGAEWNYHPSPHGTVLRSVAIDERGRIFTSGYREIGFWERDRMGNLNYRSLNHLAEPLFGQNEEFWTTVISDNKVYFHSFSSIFIYDYEGFKVVRPGALIHSVSLVDGRLCLHLSGRGLYLMEDTLLTPYVTVPEIRENRVAFTRQLPDSSLLIGTESAGLFLYSGTGLVPYLEEWKDYFTRNKINRGAIAGNGNVVIGTLLDGIMIFDSQGNLLLHLNSDTGLQNNTVLGIHCRGEHQIWLALDQGVDYVSLKVDPSYTIYRQEDIGAVYSAALYGGNLYLCTNQGVFWREWDREDRPFRFIAGTQAQAWNINQYDGELIVSHNNGTFRIENNEAVQISPVSGGFSLIKHPRKDDVLVQSTYSNIVFFGKERGRWQYDYQLPGFNDLIRYIEFDHMGNLWASHMHRAIYKIRMNDAQDSILDLQYFGNSVFGKDYDIQVFRIENRIVFTTGEQIYTYNDINDSILPYDHLNSHLGKYAASHRVIPGPGHHYWFICREGIALFRIFNSEVQQIKEYPRALFGGHLITGYENVIPLAPMEGLLCMDNGYAILRADRPDLSRLIEDKRLLLKRVGIRGLNGRIEQLPVDSITIRIPHKKNSLTLTFAFPLYSNEPVEFQSYVEGLDETWGRPLAKPVFNFERIPYGEYTIHARVSNVWGRQGSPAQIGLVVSPPWYLSRVSILIYVLVFLLLLLLGRYLLLRRIRSREKQIREAKEKELIRLRNEKLNAELEFKSQELANSTMAIIKKNEFLMELTEVIKKQKAELGTRFPDKYYSRLVGKIDQNISSMDDWNVFQIHFEKAHEQFLQKLMSRYPHLSHSDLRLCAYLRMNLSSKEIAPLMQISYRGVENHRYKLRKKLGLKKDENLTNFILSI